MQQPRNLLLTDKQTRALRVNYPWTTRAVNTVTRDNML